MYDDQRDRDRRARFHEAMARERQTLDQLSEALLRGSATGTPMSREDVDNVREAVAISKRRYPKGTVFDSNGQAWIKGPFGAMTPSYPDLPDMEDFENEQRAERRFQKKAGRLYNRMRATYPDIGDDALRAAANNLMTTSGMTLDQISDLAEDDPETLMEAVAQAGSYMQTMSEVERENAPQHPTAGIPGGSGYGERGGSVNAEDEEIGSMSADIAAWQKKTGFGR